MQPMLLCVVLLGQPLHDIGESLGIPRASLSETISGFFCFNNRACMVPMGGNECSGKAKVRFHFTHLHAIVCIVNGDRAFE